MADITPQKALEKVADWLTGESGFTIDESGAVVVDGNPPLELGLSADDGRIVITHVTTEEGAGAARADAVIAAFPDRGTTMHAVAAVDRAGVLITVTNHVYVDGLSRQTFMTALNELVAAVDTIGQTTVTETRVHEPVTTGAAENPKTDTAPETTTPTATAPTTGWNPTHRVPSAGMRAWAEPDPSQQPVTRLEPGVELVVAEQRGDWARVVGSNDWTGWIDARQLQEIGAASATTSATVNLGGIELRPLPLIGAAALLLAAFLPWVSGFTSVNSLDVALSFLWDLNAAGSPYLGWVIIGIAVIALALAVMKKPNPSLLRLMGLLAIAITAAFLVQMYRGITDSGGTFGDVFDFLGIAPWVSLGAGVVLIAGSKKSTLSG
ncbi:MAG: SH3 domain-containing protein [Acidimicrobiia bacterium]